MLYYFELAETNLQNSYEIKAFSALVPVFGPAPGAKILWLVKKKGRED